MCPIYEFSCDDCGLQFEILKGISQYNQVQHCPECGLQARKLMSVANHAFVFPESQMRGPLPPNTGTSMDFNVDKVIGRDAETRWAKIEERTHYKEGKIRDAAKNQQVAATMDQLVKTREGAGDYRIITEKERQVVNARRVLASAIAKAASESNTEK